MIRETLTLATIIAAKAGVALAMAEQTLSISGASIRAVLGHVLGDARLEGDLLLVAVIVVQ